MQADFLHEHYFIAIIVIIGAYMLDNDNTKNVNVSQVVEKLSVDEKDYCKWF